MNGVNTQTSPDVAISAQQPSNDSLVSIYSGIPNDYDDAYDDEVPIPAQHPTDSLIPVRVSNKSVSQSSVEDIFQLIGLL
jgi:hypothetical protein